MKRKCPDITEEYLLLVLNGMEEYVIGEIQNTFSSSHVISLTNLTIKERIHGDTLHSPAGIGKLHLILHQHENNITQLHALASVQCVLLYIHHTYDIAQMDIHEPARLAKDIVETVQWSAALEIWKSIQNETALKEITFRVSAIRDGKHAYQKREVAGSVGACIGKTYPDWKVNLTKFNLEVVVLLFENFSIAGLHLPRTNVLENASFPDFAKRLPSELGRKELPLIVQDRQTSLRPSTAYLMLKLAEITSGDIVVDCMAGVGTIPIYAASCPPFPTVFALGADIDDAALPSMTLNMTASRNKKVDGIQWDSRRMSCRSNTVDKVVVDMPFGQRCGSFKSAANLIPKILSELSRVLRENGKAVLLVMAKKAMRSYLTSSKASKVWLIENVIDVNVGGMGAAIFVINKKKENILE